MIRFEFEMPEKVSTNESYAGQHWTARRRHKNLFRFCCHNEILSKLPEKPTTFPVDLDFVFYFTAKPLDTSNCSYMLKIIEDCLVKQKFIPDDGIKYVRKISFESRKGERDKIILNVIQ